MTYSRKLALATGIFFLITIIASIPAAFVFYAPVLGDPRYILGGGADTSVFWGAFLEVITALACIGTAVALFPVVKKQNEAVALGYVAVRVLEATIIAVGIVSLLSVVTLRQDFAGAAGADAASLGQLGQGLVAIHDATFLIGPGLLAGLGNGMLLGYLMYRSRLVPRRMALLGLVGGPWSPLRGSPSCSVSTSKSPRWRPSPRSRKPFGRRRSASGSSSRDSIHLPRSFPSPAQQTRPGVTRRAAN